MNKFVIIFLISLIPFFAFSQRAKLYNGFSDSVFYNNGNLKISRNFKEGKLLGYKTYYRSGVLQSNYVFNSKGYHDSIANFYYPNGKVKTIWKYKKGVVKNREDFTLNGNEIKGEKIYKQLRVCNYNLPFGKNNLSWSYKRGLLNLKLGFYHEALEDFNFVLSKKIKTLKPTIERSIYHNMGVAHSAIEDFEKALKYNFLALTFEPKNQAVLNNIGSLLLKVKDYDLALEYLNKCHQINPNNYYAFFNKAILYLETKDYDKAYDFINKTIADKRSHKLSKKNISNEKTIWSIRGEIYRNLGRLDEAILDLQKAIKENPTNSYAYRSLGAIYNTTNEIEKACLALSKAKAYKYDMIYETNDVNDLLDKICSTK